MSHGERACKGEGPLYIFSGGGQMIILLHHQFSYAA